MMKIYKNVNIYFIFVLKLIVKALEWRATVVAENCQSSFPTSLPQKDLALGFIK